MGEVEPMRPVRAADQLAGAAMLIRTPVRRTRLPQEPET